MDAESEASGKVERNRFAVRLEDLERQSRVHPADMVEEQAQPSLAGAWDESRRQAELAGGA